MVVFPHCNCVLEPELSPPLSLVPINSSHQIHPCCYDNCRLASTSSACFGSIGRTGLWIYCQDSTTNLSHCQSKGRYLLSLHTCWCSWCINTLSTCGYILECYKGLPRVATCKYQSQVIHGFASTNCNA